MKTRWKFVVLVVLVLVSLGCMSPRIYTRKIGTDKCPTSYERTDKMCVGEADNVLYFTTPKSSVTFHYPKGANVEEETRLFKKIQHHNIGITFLILNYKPSGYSTFEEYFDKVYYPGIYIIVDNESRIQYNLNKDRDDRDIIYSSGRIMGHDNYFGFDGWLCEFEAFSEKDPSKNIMIIQQYIFPLDDPYAIELGIVGLKEDFNENYAEILPYLNKLEINIEE